MDEELVLYDEGPARLVVRGGREPGPLTGTWAAAAAGGAEDAALLSAAGPGPVIFDLRAPAGDPPLLAAANRLAGLARGTPEAVAEFLGVPAAAGRATLAVVCRGTRAVEVELDPAGCSVQFTRDGQPVGWQPFPQPSMGFVTREAELLGGLRMTAVVAPGAVGAIAFALPGMPGATGVYLEVAGWLRAALPDEEEPAPFRVRTAEKPLPE